MNPLHQFTVREIIPLHLGGLNLSLTNSALFMLLAAAAGVFILWTLMHRGRLIPTTGQALAESLYHFIEATARDTIGPGYRPYIPFIFSVFIFILMGNLLGLFPYGFTFTGQLAPVGAFAVLGLFVSAGVGLYHHKLGWFRTFLPRGIPVILAPIVVPIELISFLAKK